LASFSKFFFWYLLKTGRVPCAGFVCITDLCCTEHCVMFLKLLSYIKFSYYEVSQAIWCVNVQPHYSGTTCK
jgi:hypothetical protein